MRKKLFLPLITTILLSSCQSKIDFEKAKAFIINNRPEEIWVKHYNSLTHEPDQVGRYFDFSAIGRKASVVIKQKFNANIVFDDVIETRKVSYDIDEGYIIIETTRSNNYYSIEYWSRYDSETLYNVMVIEENLKEPIVSDSKQSAYFCEYFGYYVSSFLSYDLIFGRFMLKSIYNYLDQDSKKFNEEFASYSFNIKDGNLYGHQISNFYCENGFLTYHDQSENTDYLKVKMVCDFVTSDNGFIKEAETKYIVDKKEYFVNSLEYVEFDPTHKDIINQYINK